MGYAKKPPAPEFAMKPRLSHRRNRALTKIEVVVIVATLAVLAALLLPALPATKRKSSHLNGTINHISKVKPIGLQRVLQQTGLVTNRLVLP
jgi:hypothetical protein